MRLHTMIGALAAAAIVMTGCSNQEPEEQIYEHLEEAVSQEETFREQQEPMVELEEKEQQLYDEIIALNMDQFDQIKEKSEEAAGIVEERRNKLELEKESIDAAKAEFDEIKSPVEDLGEENEEARDKAQELIDVMEKRYSTYEELYSAYDEALTLDAELYEMTRKEDLKEEDLKAQVEQINESYNQVIEKNEAFNQYTDEYNTLKKELYETMELEVTYEETEEDTTEEDAS
ncbi:YkyA family protein [Halobacillus halophilus]|uniref:YkyA family protein n=1 Tax=Halobacillus halophilus TaxID=1570 RepID=UPI00301D57B0